MAVSSLVTILAELVVKESELITGIEEEVEWIERELRLMETVLESVRAREEQDPCAMEWEKETEELARRAEDLIATYTKRFQKQGTVDLRRKYNFVKRRGLAIELKELMTQIHSVSEKGKKIIIGNSADKDQDGQITVETETLDTERGWRSNNTVSSAMEQLNTVLSQRWLLDASDLKVVKSVRDELTPLQDLLDEVEGLEDQQLYQVWVHQIEGVFQLVYETFAPRGVKQGNGFRSLIAPLYNVPLPRLDQKILKIRKHIFEICRRYHTYEIAEFRGRETWRRVVVPKLISPDIYTSVSAGSSSTKDITEWLRVEMELMKYFIEHAQIREDSDERHKVWFRQMEEIYPDLEAKAVFAQGIIEERGYLFNPLSLIRFENRVKKIKKQIYYMSNRKIAYDISSSIMQQAASTVIPQPPPLDILPGDDEEHTLRESNPRQRQWWSLFCLTWRSLIIRCFRYWLSELEGTSFSEYSIATLPYFIISRTILPTIGNTSDLRHSVERELQLMDALLKDIRTMMELDARLNIWAEEVQAVVEEARHVLEQGAGPAILLHKRFDFSNLAITLQILKLVALFSPHYGILSVLFV